MVTPKKDVTPKPKPIEVPFDKVIPMPKPKPQPKPIDPIEEVPAPKPSPVQPRPTVHVQKFTFFGTPVEVRINKQQLFRLKKLNEEAIADAWLQLSEEKYTNLIHDCLTIREEYDLCDWAYLMMLESMSEAVCGKNTNEATLLMAYTYCQSGYRMRMAIGGDRLYMLFASDHLIYGRNYFKFNNECYYILDKNAPKQMKICEQAYPKEQTMSLFINKAPKLAMAQTKASSHQSVRNQEMSITMTANKNMLDFYASYPTSKYGENMVSRWAMYANMPIPNNIVEQIYPSLMKTVSLCDQWTAVNRILNFVQTGFVYEYDDKVWGGDRAFFPEESLHYPYCDCEDRSILFTRLVRDLLELECILIYYPGHLAAAVEITEGNPTGDYISYNGHRYFIADPTITGYGAPVGTTMKGMDNKAAQVILLE
ncbi:MAG: hypothetical protein IKU98_03890 [Bacteroidaceae bacterium]|nr:hypothetical protein [Bacteroidaceae bacterium]